MPISQFSPALQKALSFLPGTYATSLMRNHALKSSFARLEREGIPSEFVEELKKVFDLNVYFNSERVSVGTMYIILIATILILITAYVMMNIILNKRKASK